MWDKVLELVKEGAIAQNLIAIAATGAVIYLSVTGQAVPAELAAISAASIGFYLGRGTEIAVQRAKLRK